MKNTQKTLSCKLIGLMLSSLVLCCSQVFSQTVPPAQPTPEELVIKGAYLKLSLYNTISNRHAAGLSNQKHDPANDLSFAISNIHTGPISEIVSRPIYDLITSPWGGDTISFTSQVTTFRGGPTEMIMYEGKWQRGEYVSAVVPTKMTVQQMFNSSGRKYADVGKYTTYDITIRLDKKSRSYKAMVLYHNPNLSTSTLKPEFIDSVAGGGELNDVLKETRPPFNAVEFKKAGTTGELRNPPSGMSRKIPPDSLVQGGTLPYDCNSDQPMCCPKGASSISECCWNPAYFHENPGVVSTCSPADKKSVRKAPSIGRYMPGAVSAKLVCKINLVF